MNHKKTAALLAAVILLTGCAKGGTSDQSESGSPDSSLSSEQTSATTASADSSQPPDQTPQTQPTVLAEGYCDDGAVIAHSDREGAEDITFGDFIKEYKYFLAGSGLSDDTTEPYVETLTQRREYIANYLINARIISAKFKEIFPEGFSQEEEAQIEAGFQEGMSQMKASLASGIMAMQQTAVSEEELNAQIDASLKQIMDNCGLTEEDFRRWQREAAEQEKLMAHLTADITVDRAEAEEQTKASAENAKAAYESDPASYDPSASSLFFLPDGSRYVKHILLKFEDADVQQILTLRAEGKDDEADALREEKLAELSEMLVQVQAKVDAGEDFDTLMAAYSEDGDVTMKYLVAPKTQQYMEGFAECALGITEVGGTDTCSTDYGWHIIKYVEDAVITDEAYNETVNYVQQYLLESKQTQTFNAAVKEWRGEFNYTIDRNLLLLGAEE